MCVNKLRELVHSILGSFNHVLLCKKIGFKDTSQNYLSIMERSRYNKIRFQTQDDGVERPDGTVLKRFEPRGNDKLKLRKKSTTVSEQRHRDAKLAWYFHITKYRRFVLKTHFIFFKGHICSRVSSGTRFDHGQFEIKIFPIYGWPY